MLNTVLGCALGIAIGFGWAEWLDREAGGPAQVVGVL